MLKKPKIYIDLTILMQTGFLTGIQRVIIEIVIRLLKRDDIDVVMLSYTNENEYFRLIDNDAFLEFYEQKTGTKAACVLNKYMEKSEFEPGSVFFDIDGVWNSRLTRSSFYPVLKKQGIKIVTHVYDIIPITHPQYCHENTVMHFIEYLGATLQYADKLIVNTQATADQIAAVCERMGRKMPAYAVAPLGCDFKKPDTTIIPTTHINEDGEEEVDEEFKHLIPDPDVSEIINAGKYILMVGTIEPRKNHAYVLDALDKGMKINVVFAGRIGWNIDSLIKRIENHPLYNKRLFLINGANDAAINMLYENAYLLAFPTFNEGFGLPIIEAIQHGTLVVASDIPVLREVGKDYADYIDNTDCNALVKYVDNCLSNPDEYAKKKAKLSTYVPYTWDNSEKLMYEAVVSTAQPVGNVPDELEVKQMVVLTARNQDILASLPFIEHFMPFIKELIVCCPERNVEPFKAEYKGRLKLTFKTDDQLLNGRELPSDHQARNFFLRCMIMKLEELDDVFIMTDDDYRPLKPITRDVFIKNGRYVGYYFYDLTKWQGSLTTLTSFDEGAFKTRDFLLSQDYPTLQYSSHQPQIIDKRIFNEMLSVHKGIENNAYDEWSTYFNFGMKHHSDIFSSKVNVSMCWPDMFSSWDLMYFPGPFLFENYYESMYDKDGLFYGFSKEFNENITEENTQKEFLYAQEARKQFENKKIFESYCYQYSDQIGDFPAFVAYLHPDSKELQLHVPQFIHLQSNCWTRVPLTIFKDVVEAYSDCDIVVSYSVRNIRDLTILEAPPVTLLKNRESFNLPVRSPKSRMNKCTMFFKITVERPLGTPSDDGSAPEKEIVAEIEKSLPLTLS